MSFSDTLVINDGTQDKSYVSIIRNGRSTTRRSSHVSDPATEPRTLLMSVQDVVAKAGRSQRVLVQTQKTYLDTDLKANNATCNVTFSIPAGVVLTDAQIAELAMTSVHAAIGAAKTAASASTNIARFRLGES